MTERDVQLAGSITAAVGQRGDPPRSVQLLEIGVDAMDIAAIRPFWKAVLGYADEPVPTGRRMRSSIRPARVRKLVPAMSQPHTERDRIHFDLCVPHDEATARLQAAWTPVAATVRRRGSVLLGAGRPRRRRGMRHDLAGPGLAGHDALWSGTSIHCRRLTIHCDDLPCITLVILPGINRMRPGKES